MLGVVFRAILLIAILLLSLWLAFYVLVVGLLVGVTVGAYMAINRFLISKSIIKPTVRRGYGFRHNKPRHYSASDNTQIITTEYQEVTITSDNDDDPRISSGRS